MYSNRSTTQMSMVFMNDCISFHVHQAWPSGLQLR
jgi:hypothetical protein